MLGLQDVLLITLMHDTVAGWLRQYGPAWTIGNKVTSTSSYGHVVVIAGVSSIGYYIHDLEPMNIGWQGWKPVSWLMTALEWGVIGWKMRNFLSYPR